MFFNETVSNDQKWKALKNRSRNKRNILFLISLLDYMRAATINLDIILKSCSYIPESTLMLHCCAFWFFFLLFGRI